MNKIVSMLTRKESMPMQSYRRVRKIKDSTSSCSCDDENESLLKIEDRATGNIYFAKRRTKRSITEDDCDENFSEIVDEEEVIHIEVGDDDEELLPRDRRDKRKLGRINRIVNAVARIPWLGKGEV